MCLYHTYQWSCCPGTAQPAPYYMNSKCEVASAPRKSHNNASKCKIEHRILDGADHDMPCPNCGCVAMYDGSPEADVLTRVSQTASDVVEDPPAPETTIDPRYEQLAWAVGKLLQQHETLAAMNVARKDKRPSKTSRVQKRR